MVAQNVKNDKTQGSRSKLMDFRFSVQLQAYRFVVRPESELKFNSSSDFDNQIQVLPGHRVSN